MFGDVSRDDTGETFGEALPGAEARVFTATFESRPEGTDDGGTFDREEESQDEGEDDAGGDLGNGTDAIDKDAAEIADKIVGEVLEGGEDFVLKIVNAEALAEGIDAVPAAEIFFEHGGELANEADGLVNNDGSDDGDDNGDNEDNNDIGHGGGEGGVFFFGQVFDASSERLDGDGEEEGDTDDDETGEGFPDEEGNEAECEDNEPEADEGFGIDINAVTFFIHELIIT